MPFGCPEIDSKALDIDDASNDDCPPELDEVELVLAELDAEVDCPFFESVELDVPTFEDVGAPAATVEVDDGDEKDERPEKRLVSSE